MNPGIHPNVPVEQYNAIPAMRRSTLFKGCRDCEHLRWAIDHPEDETDAMLRGTAFHTALIEPERFGAYYREWEKVKGKGDAAFIDARGDAIKEGVDLYRSDWNIPGMVDRLKAHPQASKLFGGGALKGGQAEVSLVWAREGIALKTRLDGLWADRGVVVDFKTTTDVRTFATESSAEKFGYFFQAAFGIDGLRVLTGRQDWKWYVVWIEDDAPHVARVQQIGQVGQERGKQLVERAWSVYMAGVRTGRWVAYPDVDELIPPSWAVRELDEEARAREAFS